MTNALVAIFKTLPGFMAVQDRQHRYIAATPEVAKITGCASVDDMLGKRNSELNWSIANIADQLEAQNEEVLKTLQVYREVGIYGPYTDGKVRIFLTNRHPYYDLNRELIGVFVQAISFERFEHISEVFFLDQKNYADNQNQAYKILTEGQSSRLSIRELECLFYLLRGFSAKAIGQRLHLSSKTIEFHQAALRDKFKAQNKAELIKIAIDEGYLFLIPESLLQ